MGQPDPFATLSTLGAALDRGTLSSVEITEFFLDRIARLDPVLSSFSEVQAETALEAARGQDALRRAGVDLGPLQGLPIAVKDLLHAKGTRCGAGSALRANAAVSTEDSDTIERLNRAGMIVLGRTHLVEFAFGGWGTNAAYGAPKNPWDSSVHRVPGGSSSGSGVAVGGGLCPVAIGTDTGGSVRIPSSFNGITGLKPSFGQVSNRGCIPLSTTLDSIGPMAHSVADLRLVYRVLSDQHWTGAPMNGRRLAFLPESALSPVTSPEVAAHYQQVMRALAADGWSLSPIELPFAFDALAAASGDIISAEAYTYHRATMESDPQAYGPETFKRLMNGAHLSAYDYLNRLTERAERIAAFEAAMRPFDALILPTTAFTAIPLSEIDEDRTPMSVYTRPVNYLDGCAVAMPSGLDAKGLPFSMQLVAPAGREESLLGLAAALEEMLAFTQRPALTFGA